jgi:hypothetical protein
VHHLAGSELSRPSNLGAHLTLEDGSIIVLVEQTELLLELVDLVVCELFKCAGPGAWQLLQYSPLVAVISEGHSNIHTIVLNSPISKSANLAPPLLQLRLKVEI